MTAVRTYSSAAGVLSLLSEPEPIIKEHALKTLNPLVTQFWAEISEHIALIESLYESNDISKAARDSAALLASKVYYSLGEYDEALSFALGAGQAFAAEARSTGSEEYVETVVSKAIDRYISLRNEETASTQDKIDPRLRDIIEDIFKRCIEDKEYKQAIGIALESQRLDVVKHIYEITQDTALLTYAMDSVIDSNVSLSHRDKVLHFLLPLFPPPGSDFKSPHVHALTRLLVTLSQPSLTVPLLTSLVPGNTLLAYQFAFDLVEGGAQDFLENVRSELPQGDESSQEAYDNLRKIFGRQLSVQLYVEFLKRNNKVDMLVLKSTKESLEARSSIYHSALTFQNAFMHSGTTSDVFLRENLEWLGLASNWSKFTATAALGVIHKGWFEQAMVILGPYLPSASGGESTMAGAAYSEGGALYALGLVNAGCGSGQQVEGYLRDTLKAAQGEVVQHGAALGLGIAVMGGRSADAYEDLKQTLFTDSAVAGEAAGYSMGLIMLGSADATCADEMLTYARETQHEKIIRGLAIGLAFIYYGRQEEADGMIQTLLEEKDPILRYGGVYALALAYAGTSNNGAVRRLLHIAVSDTSDDVRRAAVTSLAFLLFKNPSQVPRIVQLLSESYNPHVRCGATLALGIACAGTGLQDAVEILEPLTKDGTDFVRQGAFIALGMVMVEQSEASSPSMISTRATYSKIVADKHEDPMARFGAALGQGLIDAGGRNVTISLQSRAGTKNMSAIVGMTLFAQFWYWYPLAHCACLAFEPTGIIGLTEELLPPKFSFVSNAKPSLFAYPPTVKTTKKEAPTKVATAVLSTTAKVKAREKKKAAETDSMDTDDKPEAKADPDTDMKTDVPPSSKHGDVSPISGSLHPGSNEKPADVPTKPQRKAEPSFEELQNLARVTPAQLAYITFPPEGRYQPVRPVSTRPLSSTRAKSLRATGAERLAGGGGILLLRDSRSGEDHEYITLETRTPAVPPPAEAIPTSEGDYEAPIIPDDGEPPRMDRTSSDLDTPGEALPPQPFEYPFGQDET